MKKRIIAKKYKIVNKVTGEEISMEKFKLGIEMNNLQAELDKKKKLFNKLN